jgi:hypothetical protein
MTRHLTTLILSGILGSIVLAGNAEACHKKRCGCAAPPTCAPPAPVVRVEPVVCARPAPCPKPAPCARPVATCAPRVKKCGGCGLGGLFAGLCHKKPVAVVACATPVSYGYSTGPVVPSGQYLPTPQASMQR